MSASPGGSAIGMTECRHEGPPTAAYGRVLWVVLLTNAAMFVVEMTAGVIGQSVALQADAVDSSATPPPTPSR